LLQLRKLISGIGYKSVTRRRSVVGGIEKYQKFIDLGIGDFFCGFVEWF
jgi:hypothetical protein